MLGWARRVEDRPAPQLSSLFSGSWPTQCLCSRPSWVNPVTGHYLSTKRPFLGYSTGTCCSAFWWNLRWRVFLHFGCLTASIQGKESGREKGEGIRERWKGPFRAFPPLLPSPFMRLSRRLHPLPIFSVVYSLVYTSSQFTCYVLIILAAFKPVWVEPHGFSILCSSIKRSPMNIEL